MSVTREANISVPADIARRFNAASPEERERALFRLRLSLARPGKKDLEAFFQSMDAMGAKAAARGLTPEVLDKLLDG